MKDKANGESDGLDVSANTCNNGYDLELSRLADQIRKCRAKRLLIQLPDGLKPRAKEIADYLKQSMPKVETCIWAGSCFGACDVPEASGFDLMIQWGHSAWR